MEVHTKNYKLVLMSGEGLSPEISILGVENGMYVFCKFCFLWSRCIKMNIQKFDTKNLIPTID